jgi:hypothetical protein
VSQHDPSAHADLVGAVLGDHTSPINSWYYQKYGRRRFVASPTDWGWYGPPEHGRNGCILESDVALSLGRHEGTVLAGGAVALRVAVREGVRKVASGRE